MHGLISLVLAVLLPLFARADEHIVFNTPSTATPILVVFGDSLSDTGNSDTITRDIGGPVHPPSEYYEGRFSDGRMWPDYIKNMTGWDVLNYAVGSTTACPLSDQVLQFNASLGIQVSRFLNKEVPWMDEASPEESMALLNSPRPMVIAIMSGSNDFQIIYNEALQRENLTMTPPLTRDQAMQNLIDDGAPNATDIARCYMGAVEQLLPSNQDSQIDLRRVRGMVLYGPAAVYETPLVLNSEYIGFNNDTRVKIEQEVQELNGLLELRLSQLSLPTGVRAQFINLASVQTRYANGGFPEFAPNPIANEPCLDIVGIQGAQDVEINNTCANPSAYMFWDTVHPRTTVHEALATFSMETIKGVAVGLMSATPDERSGEVTITIQYRVSGYDGKRLRTDQQERRMDLFHRLSSAVAQNLALMRPDLMLVPNATELQLVESTSQRRALKQVTGPCVECVQNEIIKDENVFSAPQENFVPIETTILLPDDTDESTLNDFVAEIRSEGANIFNGSGEEMNIGVSFIGGTTSNALRSLASVTTCVMSVLSVIFLAML